jgi:D-alanine-D-alanine ligase
MSQAETSADRLRIVVLAGGDSAEREVSLESGRNVANALQQRGHQVQLLDPAKSPLSSIAADTDIVLPMLHGTGAEDGVLQTQLDQLGIPWLGSSAEASRLTFNKIATRTTLQAAGLLVPPGVALNRISSPSLIHEAARCVGYPLVVKPSEQGSSVGVSIVQQESQLDDAVREATRWCPRFLIEQFIVGREITVPVINGVAFPAIEIVPSGAWYDYQAKYHDEQTQYRVSPPGLPDSLNESVLRACGVCGVSAISRTDLRVDASGRCWILEINTIPGMTSHSLVPMSAQALGISLGELCEHVLQQRLNRISSVAWESQISRRAA